MQNTTHESAMQKAKELYQTMCELRDASPIYLWDDECIQMEGLIADMEVTYARRCEDLSESLPSDYLQHNTLNHVMQGTIR